MVDIQSESEDFETNRDNDETIRIHRGDPNNERGRPLSWCCFTKFFAAWSLLAPSVFEVERANVLN